MRVSEHIFGVVLDQDITGTVIMDMPLLETMKIPKTDAACYLLDGKPAPLSGNSCFRLKTSKLGTIRNKLDKHSLHYNPCTKNKHMAQVAGKVLCSLQAIHHAACLCRMLSPAAFECMKALYFNIEPQGDEAQKQMRNRLLDKRKECLHHMIHTQMMTRQFYS